MCAHCAFDNRRVVFNCVCLCMFFFFVLRVVRAVVVAFAWSCVRPCVRAFCVVGRVLGLLDALDFIYSIGYVRVLLTYVCWVGLRVCICEMLCVSALWADLVICRCVRFDTQVLLSRGDDMLPSYVSAVVPPSSPPAACLCIWLCIVWCGDKSVCTRCCFFLLSASLLSTLFVFVV